jgi:hypothetical protein
MRSLVEYFQWASFLHGVNENRLGVIQAQFQVRTHQQFNMGQSFEINIIAKLHLISMGITTFPVTF